MSTHIITRKLQLKVVGGKEETARAYKWIRDCMESQSRAMNYYMSFLYYEAIRDMLDKDGKKEFNKFFQRTGTGKLENAYPSDVKFPTGYRMGLLGTKVNKDFSNDMKKGLEYGNRSLRTYKKDSPALVHNCQINFYHGYDSDDEFYEKLYTERNLKLYMDFVDNIKFKVLIGDAKDPKRGEFEKIFRHMTVDKKVDSSWKVCDSSIGLIKKGKYDKIMLNLSICVPSIKKELDENTVVGADLGLAIPAVCALNNNERARKDIGSFDDFTRVRTRMQSQYRRLQSSLSSVSGGHGREKKMVALDRLTKHERNWVHNYNHFVSKEVIKFALDNKAKYINLEDLSGYSDAEKGGFVLRNWSYYELQTMIKNKASRFGIEVRFVNSKYTSQTCSCCGERGIRAKQAEFTCQNPECKNYGKVVNADFNAARIIAMSEDFTDKTK